MTLNIFTACFLEIMNFVFWENRICRSVEKHYFLLEKWSKMANKKQKTKKKQYPTDFFPLFFLSFFLIQLKKMLFTGYTFCYIILRKQNVSPNNTLVKTLAFHFHLSFHLSSLQALFCIFFIYICIIESQPSPIPPFTVSHMLVKKTLVVVI